MDSHSSRSTVLGMRQILNRSKEYELNELLRQRTLALHQNPFSSRDPRLDNISQPPVATVQCRLLPMQKESSWHVPLQTWPVKSSHVRFSVVSPFPLADAEGVEVLGMEKAPCGKTLVS